MVYLPAKAGQGTGNSLICRPLPRQRPQIRRRPGGLQFARVAVDGPAALRQLGLLVGRKATDSSGQLPAIQKLLDDDVVDRHRLELTERLRAAARHRCRPTVIRPERAHLVAREPDADHAVRGDVRVDHVTLVAGHGPRLGLIVGKKTAPRAIDRNRVRRLVRIVHRELAAELDALDVVVQLRSSPRSANNAALFKELQELLRGLLVAGS